MISQFGEYCPLVLMGMMRSGMLLGAELGRDVPGEEARGASRRRTLKPGAKRPKAVCTDWGRGRVTGAPSKEDAP